MKKTYNVLLEEGVDKNAFLSSMGAEHCTCISDCCFIPGVLIVEFEECDLQNYKNNSDVKFVEEAKEPVPAGISSLYSMEATYTGRAADISDPLYQDFDGRNLASLTHYFFSNQINTSENIGIHPSDDSDIIESETFKTYWTGKNVDIVILEVEIDRSLTYSNYHDTHPEFKDPDNLNASRFVPMNWPGLDAEANNQESLSNILTSHALGTLSVCAGLSGGFAKRSSLRCVYSSNGISSAINSVISWHNDKEVNPDTGVKNPTILIHEYQYLLGNYTAVKIADISSFTFGLTGNSIVTNRPQGGWGTNFTQFTALGIIPKRVRDPVTGLWHWCISASYTTGGNVIQSSVSAAAAAGIINIAPAGNDGGIYSKSGDLANYAAIDVDSGATIYNISSGFNTFIGLSRTVLSEPLTITLFDPYGPNGNINGIDVSAMQLSDSFPILDYYSGRGRATDIIGGGQRTWGAYPEILSIASNASKSWPVVAANDIGSFAIDSNGALYAWGGARLSGTGTTVRSSPVQIGTNSWVALAASLSNAAAIRSDGLLFTWGSNERGQLGDGTITSRSSPVQIGTDSWTAVSVSRSNAAAIRSDGLLFTWGDNGAGQIGNNTQSLSGRSSPVQIGTDTWMSVSYGDDFCLGIKSNGTVFGWGALTFPFIGTPGLRYSPVLMLAGSFTAVSSGRTHATLIRSDGALFTWGGNNQGQLGDGTNINRSSPVQIGIGQSWIAVSAKENITAAIRSDGKLFAWGVNSNGQLGDGTNINRSSPVQIGTYSWTAISAGATHTLGVREGNKLYAWGNNNGGKLGDNSTTNINYPSLASIDLAFKAYYGMFNGTSAATPSVAGVVACLMERYFYFNKTWPTFSQIKNILQLQSKKDFLVDGNSTNWSSAPSASSTISNSDFANNGNDLLNISTSNFLNGGIVQRELANTPNRMAFIDNSTNSIYLRRQATNRPASGVMFPRFSIKLT